MSGGGRRDARASGPRYALARRSQGRERFGLREVAIMDLEDLFEGRRHVRHGADDHHDHAEEFHHGDHDDPHWKRSGTHFEEDHASVYRHRHHGHASTGALLASPWVRALRTSRSAQLGLVVVAVVLLALVTTALWALLGYVRAQGLQALVEGALRVGETLWKGTASSR